MKLKYIGKDGASVLRYGEVYSARKYCVGYSIWLVANVPGLVGDVAVRYDTLKDLMSDWEEV